MPIQIKELIIKATVSPQPGSSVSTNGQTAPGNFDKEKLQEQTIRRCVDEVLEILRMQNER